MGARFSASTALLDSARFECQRYRPVSNEDDQNPPLQMDPSERVSGTSHIRNCPQASIRASFYEKRR